MLASALHLGCPQPLALTPSCCPACGVMSYTTLSGRLESPLTPLEIVGGLGVSGDSSCADHNIGWRTRHALELDYVPKPWL